MSILTITNIFVIVIVNGCGNAILLNDDRLCYDLMTGWEGEEEGKEGGVEGLEWAPAYPHTLAALHIRLHRCRLHAGGL